MSFEKYCFEIAVQNKSPVVFHRKQLFVFQNSFKYFLLVAFSAIFEYTISEPKACRSSRLEYGERVCLASASDGVL